MAKLKVPVLVTVIGEGGSGGALAIGVGDQVLMLENAIYSVISPEGCAAILWKDSSQADRAAASLRLTAEDLLKEDLIDVIFAEPPGGAHVDYDIAAENLSSVLEEKLLKIVAVSTQERIVERYRKLQRYGKWGYLAG
jgi:acetyl-CoA carboxylase carboxyl transferase subunit alpha